LVIFISYGKENNSGSVWECGYAYAKDIPVVVIKMTDDAESLMITNTARAIIKEEDIENYDFVNLPVVKIDLDKLS
jgi:nucleoside deoxyribosyltransferase